MKKQSLTILTAAAVTAFSINAIQVVAQGGQTPADLCSAALPAEDPASRDFTQPEQVLEPGVDYRAVLCTTAGPVYVDLFEEYTPITVNNFVFLAEQGYYNNTSFHRVIEQFMAQGGDPTATGSGGPGYEFTDEFVGLLHFDQPGLLAMANSGANTNGSQFFITTVPTPHLDYKHTIFGEVLEGQENVTAIEIRDPASATTPGTLLETVVIIADPAEVTTTFRAPEPATQEDITARLNGIAEFLPPEALNTVTAQTTEEVVAAAPEEQQEAVEAFLTAHNHDYRVSSTIDFCSAGDIGLFGISYTLDRFASREDATAALEDPATTDLMTTAGLTASTPENVPNPMYAQAVTACDQEAVLNTTQWQRGHFVATVSITAPQATLDQVGADILLNELVGRNLYEAFLSDALRREIR